MFYFWKFRVRFTRISFTSIFARTNCACKVVTFVLSFIGSHKLFMFGVSGFIDMKAHN